MKKISFLLMCLFAILTASCSKEDEPAQEKLDTKNIQFYIEDTRTITLENATGSVVWKSDNPLIASVVANGNKCTITAEHVGTTIIKANNHICEVKVLPKYTFFKEPYFKFGGSMSDVKKYMSWASLKESTSTSLGYFYDDLNTAYLYTFENGALDISSFATTLSNASDVIDYLLERYIPVTEIDTYTYGCLNPEKTMLVVIQLGDYLTVAYTEYNSSKSSYEEDINIMAKKLDSIKECIKF